MRVPVHLAVENIRSRSLENSLRCLGRPSVFAAVLLLLLNDQFLKQKFPSLLTGKLSDFAGLYFFPFLIALALSLAVRRWGSSQLLVGRISFLATAVFFAGIKSLPGLNHVTERALDGLFGIPSEILFDPTDLIALVILLPAWRLWNRSTDQAPSGYAWIVVALASMASAATSCPYYPVINQLIIQEDAVYAMEHEYPVGVSFDRGAAWEYASEVPDSIAEQSGSPPELPKTVCAPDAGNQCFRISGEGAVEQSRDAGTTWDVAWEVPQGRRLFMDRFSGGFVCGKPIDLGPYDMAIVGGGADYSVIVAMGNEGVLIRNPGGDWTRETVGEAEPTPFSVSSPLGTVEMLLPEIAIVVGTAALLFLVLNLSYRKSVLAALKAPLPKDRGSRWMLRPIFNSLALFLVVFVALLFLWPRAGALANASNPPDMVMRTIYLALGDMLRLSFLIPFLGFAAFWRRLRASVPNPQEVHKAVRTILSATIGIFVAGLLPIYLWSAGFIPPYVPALAISIAAVGAIIVLAVSHVRRRAEATIQAPAPTTDHTGNGL